MRTAGKILGKICLRIRDTFCPIWSVIRGGTRWDLKESGGINFLVGVTSNRSGRFKRLGTKGEPKVSPFVGNPDPPIRNTLRSVLGLLIIMILKWVRESIFFQSNKFRACRVKGRKRGGKIFDGVQSAEDYSSISRWELFKDRMKLKLQPIKILTWLLIGLNTNAFL